MLHSKSFAQPKTLDDLLLWESGELYCRNRVALAAGTAYQIGHVVAVNGSKYQPFDPAGTGTVKKAAAVVLAYVDATAVDAQGPIVERAVVVATDQLIWPAGITDAQKTAAMADLAAAGIVCRQPL